MENKRMFEPGDLVSTFSNQVGIVISKETLDRVKSSFREGRRPGHYFAPGCCHSPDYVIQIPVFFEDGTYDVMRSMNIKKRADLPGGKKQELMKMMEREG